MRVAQKSAAVALVVFLLSFQNCSRVEFNPQEILQKNLSSENGRTYDGKIQVTNVAQDASVGGYQVLTGSCIDGIDVSISYFAGVSSVASVPCLGAQFSLGVSFSGASGPRQMILVQSEQTVNHAFDIQLNYVSNNINAVAGFVGQVNALVSDPVTGKIYVGGQMTSYRGTQVSSVVRLNADGTLDFSFNTGTGFSGPVNALVWDGVRNKIYAAGSFASYDGAVVGNLVRLNTNGSRDLGFDTSVGFNGEVMALAHDSLADLLYAVGSFGTYNGIARSRAARVTSNGSVDISFDSSTGLDRPAWSVVFDSSSGKIYVGGMFSSYNGSQRDGLVRINPDGSVDNSFVVGTGVMAGSGPLALTFDSVAKQLYVASDTTIYNGTSVKGLFRLNDNGSVDLSFSPAIGPNAMIEDLAFDSIRKKLYIGGRFTNYESTNANRLARLNLDGTVDLSFHPGTGFDNSVFAFDFNATSGSLYVGGSFTVYNGLNVQSLCRLDLDGSLDGK